MDLAPIAINRSALDHLPIERQSANSTVSIQPLDSHTWLKILESVNRKLAQQRKSLAIPVSVKDGAISIHEHSMIPEFPYIVRYSRDLYEFVKKLDGSIVMSEIRIEEP